MSIFLQEPSLHCKGGFRLLKNEMSSNIQDILDRYQSLVEKHQKVRYVFKGKERRYRINQKS